MEEESDNEDSSDDDEAIFQRLRDRLKGLVETRKTLEDDSDDAAFITKQINELVHFMQENSICLGIEMMPPIQEALPAPEPAPAPTGNSVSNAIVQFVARVTHKKRERKETKATDGEDSDAMVDEEDEQTDSEEDHSAPIKKRGRGVQKD